MKKYLKELEKMTKNSADYWIKKLALIPHPEGGFYKRCFQSEQKTIIADTNEHRFQLTAIHYLLKGSNFSSFHRLKSHETWHFCEGESLVLHIISPQGNYQKIKLGNQIELDEKYMYVIPPYHWFAANLENEESYCLINCVVCPGFDFADFELGKKEELIHRFPQHKALFHQLCV